MCLRYWRILAQPFHFLFKCKKKKKKKFFFLNKRIVPNKARIGRHFSGNKYAYRDVY